ncbi:MAG: hypothetical protein M3Q88_00795 [Pseudomonadota bacterium]|nr:hypothetical protein [Pseudomonadota bacterium]
MYFSPFVTTLVVSLGTWLGVTFDAATQPRQVVQRMIVEDQIIIRVPIQQGPPRRLEWVEHKGPKCLPAAAIAGAAMVGPSMIDFMLSDRRRVRARLDSDCAGIDFYSGFYVQPQDGEVCAKREEIRSRAGSTCRIERFRSLQPKYKR